MSRLYYSDAGRTVRFGGEELSRRRKARKTLRLPQATECGGRLHVYAHPHRGFEGPLRLTVNGRPAEIASDGLDHFHWYALPVEPEHLRAGENTVELWCDSAGMDGWVLGLDSNARASDSSLSLDGGTGWQNDWMGVLHCMRGEYVLRLRLDDESPPDPSPPEPVWEDPHCPWLGELRSVIPDGIQRVRDPWQRARALCSWVSAAWPYRNTSDGIEYAPWDPLTILRWGQLGCGQEMAKPVVMCVHYGVVFVSAALALGLPARSVCATNAINGMLGHFVSEVWIEKWRKWCQVDANCDLVYVRDGVPLSVGELHPAGDELRGLAQVGPGFEMQPPEVREYAEQCFFTGRSFALWAVWPRNDYLSHPEHTPTMHGAGSYHEPQWLWANTSRREELAMFPYRVDPALLQREPPAECRRMGRDAPQGGGDEE